MASFGAGGGGGGDTLWERTGDSISPVTSGGVDTLNAAAIPFFAVSDILSGADYSVHLVFDGAGAKFDMFTGTSQFQFGNTAMFMNVGGVPIFGSDGTTLLLKEPANGVSSIELTADNLKGG